jgi:hypothetical protein
MLRQAAIHQRHHSDYTRIGRTGAAASKSRRRDLLGVSATN